MTAQAAGGFLLGVIAGAMLLRLWIELRYRDDDDDDRPGR